MKTKTELEFIKYCKSIRNPYHFDTDEFMIMIGFLKSEAIAEHEALQLKSRPPFVPGSPSYLCQMKDGRMVVKPGCNSSANWNDVIAFRELPEPYRKEPQP